MTTTHPRHPDSRRRHRPRNRRCHARRARCAGGALRVGHARSPAWRASTPRRSRCPRPRSTASAARGWRSRDRWKRRRAAASARRTSACARSSSSTPTCGPRAPSIPGGRFDNIDLVVVRENLEGLYIGHEHYIPIDDDPHAVAIATGINTRAGLRDACWSSPSSTPIAHRPQEGHDRAQGQHHEGADRPLPGDRRSSCTSSKYKGRVRARTP